MALRSRTRSQKTTEKMTVGRNVALVFSFRKMQIMYIISTFFGVLVLIYVLGNSRSTEFHIRDNWSDTRIELETKRYCSPAYLHSDHLTYSPRAPVRKLILHAVAIIFRHGDRSPINQWRTYFNELNLRQMCKTTNQELLSSVKDLKQAFHKTIPASLRNFSWYPDSEACSSAQLTEKGAEQLFKLGKKYHTRYYQLLQYVLESGKKRLSLKTLKGIVGRGGFIYLRTTEYSRTFQSGLAFLAGLLGDVIKNYTNHDDQQMLENTYQSSLFGEKLLNEIVRITSTSNVWQCTQELYTISGMEAPKCFCQKAEKVEKFKNSLNYTSEEEELLNRAKRFTAKFYGASASLGVAAEGIVSYACNGVDLPCFHVLPTSNTLGNFYPVLKCMTWREVHDLLEGIKVIERKVSKDKKSRLLSLLHSYPLLWEIWFKFSVSTGYESKGDSMKPKILIYPSHDSTIIPLIEILGLEKNLWWPAFSSSVTIELHSINSKQFYIRVFHDGYDVTMKLPFCKDKFTNADGLCLFENFTFFVLKSLQAEFNNVSYKEFCEN